LGLGRYVVDPQLIWNSGNAEQDGYWFGFDPKFNIYDTSLLPWEPTNEAGIYALALIDSPEFFFIKIGTGNLPEGTADTYLFENNPNLAYAVVALTDLNIEKIDDVERISHVGEGPGTSIPTPCCFVGSAFWPRCGRKKFRNNLF
jgi:hypothetical protein